MKKFIVFILIISIFLVLINNESKEDEGTKYLIGMSQANLSEPWRIMMNEDIKEAVKKYRDVKVIFTDAGQSSKKQINDVDKLLDYGIDILIISMNNSEDLTPIVENVYKKIPVIVLDRHVKGYDYTLFIGPDNKFIGEETGKFIVDILGDKGGDIVEIQGLLGSPPVSDRSKGMRSEIKKNKNINIIETVVADWQKDKAEDKMREIIKKHPSIDLVCAQSDAMAFGAYKGIEENKLGNIHFLGVDGLANYNGGLSLVEEGILKGTFTCPTGGKEAIEYAMEILQGKKTIPKKIILRANKIIRDNVGEYLNKKYKKEGNEVRASILLGFAQTGMESSWRDANVKSIEKAAVDYGIDLDMVYSDNSQEKQIRIVREFIRKKVDVIGLSPVVERGWEEVFKEAKEANIPIILCDRKVTIDDNNLWTSFIGSDFIEEGKRAGRWMIDYFGNSKDVINIVELKGTRGANPAIERKIGFEEVLRDTSNFKIIKSEYANFRMDMGKSVMKNILNQEKGKIDVVYAHNDDMALGAITAIEDYGLEPGKDIIVISIDGTVPALKALAAGKLNFAVECNPVLGPQIMEVTKDLFENKEVPKQIITEEEVFTQENAKKELLTKY
ncbi:MAG: substrate-binding domain-containing protein [Anaeromicrobium sp.]|uniref:substrate-binding domain-containing protein n=1 Tax=Anaeromicrobium sp. TaxID=1929132 RepID=UPI0025FFC56A|nr:substrate-binding domain-containing protein [Anaeromicrobium sp.]MCT4596061.1 substrate-binding domain-containing protein [Anaeromicrobium sp.]